MDLLRQIHPSLRTVARRLLLRTLPDRTLNHLVRHRIPRAAQIEITTHCNLQCPLCFTHVLPRESRTLPHECLKNVVSSCQGSLETIALYIQGDPLVAQDLFRFVKLCTRVGITSRVSTNGMLLDRCLDELFDSGLSVLSIAIDGVDAEDYGKYRRGGDFERVVANTRALIRARAERGSDLPKIELKAIMFSYNEDREDELVEFLESFGADRIQLKRPSYEFHLEESVEWGCDFHSESFEREAEEYLSLVDRDPRRKWARPVESSERKLFRDHRLCPRLTETAILSDGRVVACCMDGVGWTTFGNLNESDFRSIWRGEAHRRVIEQFLGGELELCRHCTLS